MQGWHTIGKSVKTTYYLNRLKKENHMITLIGTEKASDQIQQASMIRTQKRGAREELLQFDPE